MITGLHMGLSSGVNPSRVVYPGDGLVYPSSGAEMATMMGIATAPNLLARFSSTAAPVPDLAGGDDGIDVVRSGVAVQDDALLGTCAYLADGSQYWARYSSTTKFDVASQSFGFSVLGKIPSTASARRWCGKWAGAAGWVVLTYPDRVRLLVSDGTSTTQIDCLLTLSAEDYILVTGVVDRAAGAQSLWVNSLSATGVPPAGSLSNASNLEWGAAQGAGSSPETYLAQAALWDGVGAEELSQAAHNALVVAMGLPT